MFKLNNRGVALSGIFYGILLLFLFLVLSLIMVLNNGKLLYEKGKENILNKIDSQLLQFEDGTPIYFNVLTGQKCNIENYHEDNSITGYNGMTDRKTTDNQTSCLKFYAFGDIKTATKIKMILDHNTTSTILWESTGNNINGPEFNDNYILKALYNDTNSWIGTSLPTTYRISQNGYGTYEIDYFNDRQRARLITADEIARIVGADNTGTAFGFNETYSIYENTFYFDGNGTDITNWQTRTVGINNCGTSNNTVCTKEVSSFDWLYDRTNVNCKNYGCKNNSVGETSGYWTSTSTNGLNSQAWTVKYEGQLKAESVSLAGVNGVRPVIEILKSKLR